MNTMFFEFIITNIRNEYWNQFKKTFEKERRVIVGAIPALDCLNDARNYYKECNQNPNDNVFITNIQK